MVKVSEAIKQSKYLFVYGTLKEGYCNNVVLGNAELLGKATTMSDDFVMVSLGGFPGLVKSQDNGDAVHGELYEVDEDSFESCDILEGYPSFYNRQLSLFKLETGGDAVVEAWVYFLEDSGYLLHDKVEGGEW